MFLVTLTDKIPYLISSLPPAWNHLVLYRSVLLATQVIVSIDISFRPPIKKEYLINRQSLCYQLADWGSFCDATWVDIFNQPFEKYATTVSS